MILDLFPGNFLVSEERQPMIVTAAATNIDQAKRTLTVSCLIGSSEFLLTILEDLFVRVRPYYESLPALAHLGVLKQLRLRGGLVLHLDANANAADSSPPFPLRRRLFNYSDATRTV